MQFFFERPELVSLTRVMSCVLVINALVIVQRARTTKALDFKTQTKVTFISSLVSGIIGIGRNVKKSSYSCDVCNNQTCIYRKVKNKNIQH